MTSWQKGIKYGAITLAVFIILMIFSAIISLLLLFVPRNNNDNNYNNSYNESYQQIVDLEIDLDNATLEIKNGSEFKIETFDVSDNFKTYTTNNKLYIKEENFWFWNKTESRVTIYVPNYLDNLDIDIDAGKLTIDNIQVKKLDLDTNNTDTNLNNVEALKANISTGVGRVDVTGANFNDLDLETGVGEVNWQGQITGKSSIETGIGNVYLNLLGGEESYQFRVDKGLGNVLIDGNKFEDRTYGSGANSIYLETGVGNVDISFS